MNTSAFLNLIVKAETATATAAMRKFDSTVARTGTTAKTATTHSNKLSTATKSLGSRMATAAKYAAGAAAAYLSVAQAKAAIDTTQQLAASSDALSRNLGLSTKEASRWASVARTKDIDTKQLNASFGSLAKNVSVVASAGQNARQVFQRLGISEQELAVGGKTLADATRGAAHESTAHLRALRALGITQKDLKGSSAELASSMQTGLTDTTEDAAAQREAFESLGITTEDLLKTHGNFRKQIDLVADGFGKAAGNADRQAAAQTLLGRGYQNLLPLMADGSAALEKQLHLGDQYGATMGKTAVNAQVKLGAVMRESERAWQGMQVVFATALTPALKDVNEQFQKIARIMASDKLTDDEKFSKVADIIQKDFEKALDVVVDMIPTVASRVGEQAPKIAVGLVKGFLDANVWGKLLLGTWLISKMGGWGAISALGGRVGTRFGGSMAASTIATTKGIDMVGGEGRWTGMGSRIGAWIGPAIAAASVPILLIAYRKEITEFMHSKGFTLPTESVPGRSDINPDTSPGGIIGGFTNAFGGGGGKATPTAHSAYLKSIRQDISLTIKKYGSLMDIQGRWGFGARQVYIENARNAAKFGKISRDELEFLQHAFDKSTDLSGEDARRLARIIGLSNKDIQRSGEQTKNKVSADAAAQASNVSGSYRNMVDATGRGMDTLRDNTNRALAALGLDKAVQFRTNEAPLGKGNFGHRAQRGAVIPGVGDGDKVPVMAEPGEGFINKTAVKALGGPKVINAINAAIPRFASGGLVGLQPGISKLAQYAMSKLGLGISSGLRPGTGSFHNTGEAVDLVPPSMNATERIFAAFKPQLEELFYDPWGGWDSGQMIGAIGGHMDHIHAAILGAGTGGPMAQKLKRVILNGPDGPLKGMGQASLDKVYKASNRYLSKQSMAMPHVGGGAMSAGDIAQLWTSVNRGLGDPNLMARIAMAESSGNPSAIGHDPGGTTGYGLWQITSGFHDDLIRKYGGTQGILNPKNNALAAASILRSEGTGAWAASGPWSKGGMVLPYIGRFHDGGVAPREGLAHVARGESIGQPVIHVHNHISVDGSIEHLLEVIDGRAEIVVDEYRQFDKSEARRR